jgi:predicted transcriptional regulator of viral defense system
MSNDETLERLAAADGGVIKAARLVSSKIRYRGQRRLIRDGKLERLRQGYYLAKDETDGMSEREMIARLFPDGVVCMHSALFHYGYSDRTPLEWDIAIDKNVSRARFHIAYPPVRPYYLERTQLTYGVTTEDFDGGLLRVFDRDRLICECLKYETKMDREAFAQAIRAYASDPRKDIGNLLEYARARRVHRKVKEKVSIWL